MSTSVPKEKISLLNGALNTFNMPQSSIEMYKIDKLDSTQIIQMMKLLIPRTNHPSTDLMGRKADEGFADVDFVRFLKYPMLATYNIRTKKVIVNLQPLGKKEVTNIDPKGLYAIIFYGYLCKLFTIKPLKLNTYEDVSTFIYDALLKMYGRRYGIMADYLGMLPRLKFFSIAYTLVSFYGERQEVAFKRATKAGASAADFEHLDLKKYDLTDIRDFIKILSDSGVFPGIDIMFFAETIIKRYGLQMIPFFEDEMRFMATIGASSMQNANLLPIGIEVFDQNIYAKLLKIIMPYLR